MKIAAQIVSFVALAGILVSAMLFLSGSLNQETVKEMVLYGTMVWFVSAPYWMLAEEETMEVTFD